MSFLLRLIFASLGAALGVEETGAPASPVVTEPASHAELVRVVWESPAPTEAPRTAMGLAFSPDGNQLAAAIANEFVVFNVKAGSRLRVIREPGTALASSVAFTPDGAVLATGRAKPRDRTGRLWRASDGQLLREYKAENLDVTRVAFSPREGILATSGYGNGVRLWSRAEASPLGMVGRDVQVRFSLVFAPDGRSVAAPAVKPNSVQVWRVPDGAPLQRLEGHTDFVQDVAYSPDGRLLASASVDGTVQVHRASDGERLRTLGDRSRPNDRSRSVECIAFSNDARLVLAGGVAPGDEAEGRPMGVVRVWRVDGGQLLGTHRVAGGAKVNRIAVSRDEETFAYSRDDGVVVFCRVMRDVSSTGR